MKGILMPDDIDPKEVASRCLAAWSSHDLTTTRSLLDDHVRFAGPLGATEGADAYMEGIKGMVEIIERVDQHQVFAEGDDVCVIYDLVTKEPPATIPTAGWYRIRDGKITSVQAFFDARPLVASS
jgi:ketosteroid isomerase-like protein